MSDQCWCGRPSHNDLLDGCVGGGFLRAMFGPPTVESMILTAIQMSGDLMAMALGDAELAADMIAAHPTPKPSIEQDQAMLRMAGMDVTADEVRSLREWYGGSEMAA